MSLFSNLIDGSRTTTAAADKGRTRAAKVERAQATRAADAARSQRDGVRLLELLRKNFTTQNPKPAATTSRLPAPPVREDLRGHSFAGVAQAPTPKAPWRRSEAWTPETVTAQNGVTPVSRLADWQGTPTKTPEQITAEKQNAAPARQRGLYGTSPEIERRRRKLESWNRAGTSPMNVADYSPKELPDGEMTWDEYNNLSPADKASVDVNNLLMDAVAQDRTLIDTLDTDNSGSVSVAEGADHYGQSNGGTDYLTRLERVFRRADGTPRYGDGEAPYAPNTVAALSLLGIEDTTGSIEDYLAGKGLASKDELLRGANEKTTSPRAAMLTGLSQGMQALNSRLESGQAMVGGERQAASMRLTSSETNTKVLSDLVAALNTDASFADLLTSGSTEKGSAQFSLGALADPTFASNSAYYSQIIQLAQGQDDNGATLAQLQNKDYMDSVFDLWNAEGHSLNYDEWLRYLAQNSNGSQPDAAAEAEADSAAYVPGV